LARALQRTSKGRKRNQVSERRGIANSFRWRIGRKKTRAEGRKRFFEKNVDFVLGVGKTGVLQKGVSPDLRGGHGSVNQVCERREKTMCGDFRKKARLTQKKERALKREGK